LSTAVDLLDGLINIVSPYKDLGALTWDVRGDVDGDTLKIQGKGASGVNIVWWIAGFARYITPEY